METRPPPSELWTPKEVQAWTRWSRATYYRVKAKAKFRNYGSPARVLLSADEVREYVSNREFDYWSSAEAAE